MSEHSYLIPMRWADLDVLDHVNNVTYLDYVAEAREALIETGYLDETVIARSKISYRRPITLTSDPIEVQTTIDGDTLRHEVVVGGVACADVIEHLGEPDEAPVPREGALVGAISLRRSDIGPDASVTVARLFELVQEARIASIRGLLPPPRGRFVVASVTLEQCRPITWRQVPLQTRAWVTAVGRSSYSATFQLLDEGGVLVESESVFVGFDPEAQRSRPLTEGEAAALNGALVG